MRSRTLLTRALICTCAALALLAHLADADSLGNMPALDSIPESRCAPMHITAHIIFVGEHVFGAAEPAGKDACGGDISGQAPTWAWDDFPGLSPMHCRDDTAGCEFRATGITGPPGDRWVLGCIDGSSFQGPWNSCDYYAVIPRCSGNPTLELTHQREHGEVVVNFEGRDWDTRACGAVTISAASGEGSQVVATENRSDFHGTLGPLSHNICGVQLTASQQADPHRTAEASFDRGKASWVVVWATPGVTPGGERLNPGDALCADVAPAGERLWQIAAGLGQHLLEAQETTGHHWDVMADAIDKVQVLGLSLESAPSEMLEALFDPILSDPDIPTTYDNDNPYFHGIVKVGLTSGSTYDVVGNLHMMDATLYVPGNLDVQGDISGKGTIYVEGSIVAASVSDFVGVDSPTGNALVAGGALNLP